MKRTLMVAIAAMALFGACSSTPEPIQPPDEVYDEAKALRSQIMELDLARYAQSRYDAGEAAFNEGETRYTAEEYAEAETQFNTAVNSFTEVLRLGLRAIWTTRQGDADGAKGRADGVKASVAVSEKYAEAQAVYDEAVTASDTGDDVRAAELFENAEVLFEQAYELAAEKKQQAEAALSNIDKSLQDLDTRRQELEDEARDDLSIDDTDEEGAEQ
ncbi:MAG: hypothetical protein V3S41_06500 [Spirochaetia bacterium]